MENSIILIIDFFSRNSTVGEKEWKNSKKKKFRCWWVERWPKEEIWLLHTHFIQMKNEGSSFPLYYISCLEFCRLAQQQQANWEKMKVGLTFYCLFVHGYSFSATARQAILLLQIKLFTEEDGWWKGTPFIWCLTSSLSSLFPPTSFRPNWALCTTWNEDSKLLLSNLCSPNYFPFRKWWSSILTSGVRGLRPPHNPSETTHHYPIINWSQLEPQSSC